MGALPVRSISLRRPSATKPVRARSPKLARRYKACGANAAIILGNDQREIFKDDNTPAFLVFAGKTMENIHPDEEETEKLDTMGLKIALPGHVPEGGAIYPGAPDIAEALVDHLIEREFDISISVKLPEYKGHAHGIPHAYGFIFRRIMLDAPPPTVPIFSNVGETRNQPRLHGIMSSATLSKNRSMRCRTT